MFYKEVCDGVHIQTVPVFDSYNTIDVVLTINALGNVIILCGKNLLLQCVCVIIIYDELMKNFNFVLDNMEFGKVLGSKLKMFIEDEEMVDCFDELSIEYGLKEKFYVEWNEVFETLEFNVG